VELGFSAYSAAVLLLQQLAAMYLHLTSGHLYLMLLFNCRLFMPQLASKIGPVCGPEKHKMICFIQTQHPELALVVC